jgi:hypothetical protein
MRGSRTAAISFFALALACAGCGGDGPTGGVIVDDITGSGIIVTQDRAVGAFVSIDMRAVADIYLTQGGVQSLEIETDDNIIGHISTTVSNGVLIITSDVDYTTQHGVEITITIPDIENLEVSGVGTITGQNAFTLTNITLTVDGVGEITVFGTADALVANLEGVGEIDAENLVSQSAVVDISGVGDVYVNFVQGLDATISGEGDIYYLGDPQLINENITGLGSLIAL